MSSHYDTGGGLTHQTTWQDIARGYRRIFERMIPQLTRVIGEEATGVIVTMIQAVDAEAEQLATSEPHIKEVAQELRSLATELADEQFTLDALRESYGSHNRSYAERITAIADELETLY